MRWESIQPGLGLGGLVCALLVQTISLATEPSSTSKPQSASPVGSIWPAAESLSEMIRGWAATAAQEYDLTEDQQRQLEAQLLERWPPFLESIRPDLEPLLVEAGRAWYAESPPAEATVRDWARRARPLFEQISTQILSGQVRFKEILTPVQRARLEARSAKLADQFREFRSRLDDWDRGEFHAHEVWGRAADRVRSQRPRGRPVPPASQPADEVEAELAAWDEFVRAYCRQYDLDAAQRASAESILAELKQRARDFSDARRDRIAALEWLIAHPVIGADPNFVEGQLQELYGPIDAMFAELERRLERLPTEAQKRQAALKAVGQD